MSYKIGLVIGRFQPFHFGHVYLIKEALKICDKIIIAIGSSNILNKENPFSVHVRKQMVQLFLKHEKLDKQVLKIIESPDVSNDEEWLRDVLSKTGSVDVVIGNNDWVNGIFQNADFPVYLVPHYKRYLYEGETIRKLMQEQKKWQDRVPDYLVQTIRDAYRQ